LTVMHPVKAISAFKKQVKAFASEKLAMYQDDILRTSSEGRKFLSNKGDLVSLDPATVLSAREESFMSSLADKLPFVRRSGRAFNTYLNELRVATFSSVEKVMTAKGADAGELVKLAQFINAASGRGNIPKNVEKFIPFLSTVLFSPRLQYSRLETPVRLAQMLFSNNRYIQKEGARGLVTFLGGGAALVGLLNLSDFAEVEFDPRSADFGKIKVGETRFDIWTGYAQYSRFAAQMLTGERKSASGNINKASRDELITRFLQTKASPIAGLIADLVKGENYIGEEVLGDATGALKMGFNRLVPLVIQDVIEAFEEGGAGAFIAGPAAALGIGVLTYTNDLVQAQDTIAKQAGFDSWADVDPIKKRELEKLPELQRALLEYDRRSMGTQWGDWHFVGKAIEANKAEDSETAAAEYRETRDGVTFRKKMDKIFYSARESYQERNMMPQFAEVVSRLNSFTMEEAMLKLGPEEMAIKTYNDALYGEDMTDQFGNYKYDEATARREYLQETLGEEMFAYVEEAKGLKYEDYPLEYHQLVTARQVMRPYWAIEDQMLKIFGKPETPYQINKIQSTISKLRKNLRRSNSEIEKYYQMFYKSPEKTY